MLPLFRSRSHRITPKAAESRPRRPRRQQLGLESLEGRQLLSLGPEFRVNVSTIHNQLESANASAANGLSVAAWTDTFSSADHDIHAQMFNANGSLRGPEDRKSVV